MELLPLPNFYHKELALLIIFIITAISYPILKRKKGEKNQIDFNNPYEITKNLQKINTPEAKRLIKEFESYKYKKEQQSPPKQLIRRAKKILL